LYYLETDMYDIAEALYNLETDMYELTGTMYNKETDMYELAGALLHRGSFVRVSGSFVLGLLVYSIN